MVADVTALNFPTPQPRSIAKARVGIIVDASCDVPDDFLNDPDVAVIPIPIRIGSHTYMDQHDPAATRQYMRENANGEGASTQSVPLDAEAMKSLFVERFALDYDSVYCLTIAQSRSPIYDAASQGSMLALNAIRAQRQAADISRPFQFRVIDTKQMFAGSGVAPLALQSMLKAGMETRDIRDALYRVIDTSYAYAVPDDLGYARARAKLRGDKSIGMVSALVGGALDIKPVIRVAKGNTVSVGKFRGRKDAWGGLFGLVGKQVERGLHVPYVVLSYAGPLTEVQDNAQFVRLQHVCDNEGVQLHTVQMSITGMMNFGPGGLVVGFSGPEHRPQF